MCFPSAGDVLGAASGGVHLRGEKKDRGEQLRPDLRNVGVELLLLKQAHHLLLRHPNGFAAVREHEGTGELDRNRVEARRGAALVRSEVAGSSGFSSIRFIL